MPFLVELDHVKSGELLTPESGRTFIEKIILPTVATTCRRCLRNWCPAIETTMTFEPV
jgi:hypothetical protein